MKYSITVIFTFLILQVFAQQDEWIPSNTGIADFSAGESFEVEGILHLNDGSVFAFIQNHTGGTERDGVYSYNTGTESWTRIAPRINQFGYNALVSSGTRIFAVSGGSTDFKELDIANGLWSDLAGVPNMGLVISRGIGALDNKIYIHCQIQNENVIADFPEQNFVLNEMFAMEYNVDDASFTVLRNPSNPVLFASRGGNPRGPIALQNGKVYIYNTFDYRDNDGTGGIYEWDGENWNVATNGLNAINITGTGFGPIGPLYTDPNHEKLYVRTEQGLFEKAENGWFKYFFRTSQHFFVSPDYLFIDEMRAVGNGGIIRADRAVRTFLPATLGTGVDPCTQVWNHFMTPDNGVTFFAELEVRKNADGSCGGSDDDSHTGIHRFVPDYNKPGVVSNLHIDIGTYLGGKGENTVAETVILPSNKVLIAGTFRDNMFATTNPIAGLTTDANAQGKIFVLDATGTTIEQALIVGNDIRDMDTNTSGEIAITGDFGVAVLNADYSLKWRIADDIGNNGAVAIADDGKVVASLNTESGNGAGVIKLYAATNGAEIHKNTSNDSNGKHINDVEISSAGGHQAYYVCGFTQKTSNLQVAYLYAYTFADPSNRKWTTWDFSVGGTPNLQLSDNGADTRAYRIKVVDTGDVYIAAESAGGGPGGFSILAYNGKDLSTTIAQNNTDEFTNGTNSCGSCHITFLCQINPVDGVVRQGRFLHARNFFSGKTNTYRVQLGDLEVDDEGNIFTVGTSAFQIQDRDVFNINGNLVGEYAGDQYVLMLAPDFRTRALWGVFSKERGSGEENRIAVGNGKVAYIARSTQGTLMTTNNAFRAEPFNTIQADSSSTLDASDVYFAFWTKNVWETANDDEIERPFISSDSCFRTDGEVCLNSPNGDLDGGGSTIIDNIEENTSNILTPNGDGQNDTWAINGLQRIGNYKIKVFTKTGQVVFETNDIANNPWDGTNSGEELPEGIYYYVISFDNIKESATGYITLIK